MLAFDPAFDVSEIIVRLFVGPNCVMHSALTSPQPPWRDMPRVIKSWDAPLADVRSAHMPRKRPGSTSQLGRWLAIFSSRSYCHRGLWTRVGSTTFNCRTRVTSSFKGAGARSRTRGWRATTPTPFRCSHLPRGSYGFEEHVGKVKEIMEQDSRFEK